MKNTNFEQFKKDFKQDMLIKVIVALRRKRISQENASYLAKRILEIFQDEKATEVFKKINKLAETHPNILEILIKRGTEYDERQRAHDINQIQVYLRGGLPTEALAKGGEN